MRFFDAARDLASGFIRLLYPGICWVCGQALASDESRFCLSCREALIRDPLPACRRCATTTGPFVDADDGCNACRNSRFHFEQSYRLGAYEGRLKEVVLRLKHAAGEGLADVVGDLWGRHAGPFLRSLGADVVVPVPLHWRRRWQRGYNQSEALAISLAAQMGIPCRPRLLRRVRATPHQTQQTPADRRQNIKNAFRASGNVKGQTVLLVDDVMTTGSTASEAARALREAAAARVLVAVLARAK